ncbi:hypothetical protein LTV02_13280 [Nocardia yamanashiensis]|uniref:hypothetical protein n=1 Tax=Nocardia yamanashiensis TaxID=209247 RepID=UPI001E37B116|nr:hypothetical protein [Nocardia yamanashiensis]UGT44299.1 hypothetical protein LTV02_13280 [Nocardia yamanashiensis]
MKTAIAAAMISALGLLTVGTASAAAPETPQPAYTAAAKPSGGGGGGASGTPCSSPGTKSNTKPCETRGGSGQQGGGSGGGSARRGVDQR